MALKSNSPPHTASSSVSVNSRMGKTDTGDWSIDAAELHRVFPAATAETQAAERGATLDTAHLKAEVASLREMANVLRSQVDDLKTDRDAWRDQAQAAQRLRSASLPLQCAGKSVISRSRFPDRHPV
jgi:uncharacterized protein YlxW (UPF0749 family)